MTGKFPIDHAGRSETSLMLALCPETVDMNRLTSAKWYTRTATEASAQFGETGRDLVLVDADKVAGRRHLMLLDPDQFRIPSRCCCLAKEVLPTGRPFARATKRGRKRCRQVENLPPQKSLR